MKIIQATRLFTNRSYLESEKFEQSTQMSAWLILMVNC
jgi:hypothetical protein